MWPSGQLITEAPLDHESKDSYHFTLSVSDGKDANGIADSAIDDTIGVTVTVTDVNEAPVVSGPAAVSYDEGGTGAVAHYTATDPDDDNILWSLTGADSDDFEIDSSGRMTFTSSPPDFENPSDSGADNDYLVTVNASDGPLTVGPLTATVSVTVTVNNVDEAGTLTLSSPQPQAGTERSPRPSTTPTVPSRTARGPGSGPRTRPTGASSAAPEPAATPHQKPTSATSWG